MQSANLTVGVKWLLKKKKLVIRSLMVWISGPTDDLRAENDPCLAPPLSPGEGRCMAPKHPDCSLSTTLRLLVCRMGQMQKANFPYHLHPRSKSTGLSESGGYLCLGVAGMVWRVSEQRNVMDATDISRQIEKPASHFLLASSAKELSLTYMSLGRVTHEDPACPPAGRPRRPFSLRWCYSARIRVIWGQGCHVNFRSSSNSGWIQGLSR